VQNILTKVRETRTKINELHSERNVHVSKEFEEIVLALFDLVDAVNATIPREEKHHFVIMHRAYGNNPHPKFSPVIEKVRRRRTTFLNPRNCEHRLSNEVVG